MPLLAVLAGLSIGGFLLTAHAGLQLWPAVAAGLLAAPAVIAYGWGYDRMRLRAARPVPHQDPAQ